MKLENLLQETDALTYTNALKVTLTELKEHFSQIEELQSYVNNHCEAARKLIRRADNQYRMVSKLTQERQPVFTDISVEDELNTDKVKEVMENA